MTNKSSSTSVVFFLAILIGCVAVLACIILISLFEPPSTPVPSTYTANPIITLETLVDDTVTPFIQTETPSFTPTETLTPSITPIPTKTPTIFTDTPTTTPLSSTQLAITPQTLDLKIWVEVIECECNRKFGTARIRIDFINGQNPFEISGQQPVTKRTVAFNVPLGSDIYLVITSKDGLKWEGQIPIPLQCEPPRGQCIEQKPPEPPPVTQCNDGKDNDFDQKVDYPEDPGCDDKSDNSEWPFNWP